MAKRGKGGKFISTKNAARKSAGGGSVVVVSAPAAPARRRSSKRRAAPVTRRRRRRASSSRGGLLSGIGSSGGTKSRISLALGAAALGYAHKEGWLNKLPIIGKAGPITSAALIGFGLEEFGKVRLHPILHDAVTAGLVLSAFNLGFSGGNTIVGEGDAYPGGAVFFE
jgi:hypothetical protein